MRLYHRSRNDQLNACRRAVFDARHSRVKLALDRLTDIAEEGPNDSEIKAQIAYTEGVILRDFLGKGFKARELFELAYNLNPKDFNAVINATQLARDLDEFNKWVKIFQTVVPATEKLSHSQLNRRLQILEQGAAYWVLLHDLAITHGQNGVIGQAASLMELVFADHQLPFGEEPNKRRWRAQQLRALDQHAENFRKTNMEYFPPDERLALQEALIEIERAIAIDKYDAELWNFKAVWCRMLKRSEEAIMAADESIRLRPHAYANPHISKAQALWDLERDTEALASAREAVRQAEALGDAADKQHATELVDVCSRPRVKHSLHDFKPLFDRLLRGSQIQADIEMGEHQDDKPEVVILGFFNRCRKLYGKPSLAFVPIMAELLSDFCPERVFQIISRMRKLPELNLIPGRTLLDPVKMARLSQASFDHCLHAALYIIAHSEGVRQRDAARFLCLIFFSFFEPEVIRATYREAILETSAAATDEMARLDAIMREELRRIHPELPHLIAEQEPVNEKGRERAVRNILSRFTKAPSQHALRTSRGYGCAIVFFALVGVPALLTYIIGR